MAQVPAASISRIQSDIEKQWQIQTEFATKTVESIIKIGQLLLKADAYFTKTDDKIGLLNFESELPFSKSSASKYRQIASNDTLNDRSYYKQLPSSVFSLYELSQVDPKTLKNGLDRGVISADSDRSDITGYTTGRKSLAPSGGAAGRPRKQTKAVYEDLLTIKIDKSTPTEDRQQLIDAFRKLAVTLLKIAKVSAPTNFPVAVAKAIYSRYAIPKKKGNETIIWDPSMGFAGRLLGALSLTDRPIYYIGTDPNSLNYFEGQNTSRYEFLEKTFKNEVRDRRDTFRGKYLQLGSEEATKSADFRALKGKVDLVFTSPPYFSAELYNEEETQSSLKYDDYHNWRSGFLAPTLKTAAEWVRMGGYVVWNIANSGGYPLEEDTRLICRQLGLKHITTEKMIIAAGAGSKRKKSGTLSTWNFATVGGKLRKYEPVFVFKKIRDVPVLEKFAFSKLHKVLS